jgi:formamidopyrimidine-DNA glycosylase
MPELPEVETTLRGLEPHLKGQSVVKLVVRNRRLRWPIPSGLEAKLRGQTLLGMRRRAKYLLLEFPHGHLLSHLGMSGSLRLLTGDLTPQKHDHFDLAFANGMCLRYHDPRRFGLLLWTKREPAMHRLIRHLGPEPLSDKFTGEYLYRLAQKRKAAVKNFIMDGRIVVGVGNIYASEALHRAGIHPTRPAGRISLARYQNLASIIKIVLAEAIAAGGTTLKDFLNSAGLPGYFAQKLLVYGREGLPCGTCLSLIRNLTVGQRASFYCPKCQN